jgi:spermidine/putrescine transport system substrate-binding protein
MNPNDPMFQQLLRMAAAGPSRLSRRGFLRGVGAGGAAVAGAGLLSACGTQGTNTAGSNGGDETTDMSDTEKIINFSNWQLYIDVDEDDPDKRPTLDAFTAKTGIKVNYTEDINDNQSFYAKIAPQLEKGQDSGRDIVVLTDWMASRMIREGLVQDIDTSAMTNFPTNLVAALQSPSFDPTRSKTAPWQSGMTGVAYNADATGPVSSIGELLTRADLKGKVTVLTEMRDTMGLILLDEGKDPANFTPEDFDAAIATLQDAVDSGHIRQFTGNDYTDGLTKGDIAACIAWSGDVVQLQLDSDAIKFVIPPAGLMTWSDNMQIPIKARHKKNAEMLIDYYYDPAVAAQLAAYVNYFCPVQGAKEEAIKIDPDLGNNQLIFPNEDTLSKTHVFMALDEAQETDYQGKFDAVAGA